MKKFLFSFPTICIILLSVGLTAQTASTHYSISKWKVEGDGGWDLLTVDDSGQKLFISHGNVVQVINTKTGQVIATIPDTKGVHAITLAPELNKGFISAGRDTAVVVFDLSDFHTISRIKVTGINPDAILYDHFSHKVFAFNGRSNSAIVIDAALEKVLATIPLEGKPELPVSDGAGKIFLNIEDKSRICVIDAASMRVEKSWSIAPGEGPSGLALDNKNHRLFSVGDNRLMIVLDANTGEVITKLPISENVDGVAFDPVLDRVYISGGDGIMTIIQEEDANHFKVTDNLKTQKGARTIAVNAATHDIYTITADFGPKPEPTTDNPHPRAPVVPGTFVVLAIKPDK